MCCPLLQILHQQETERLGGVTTDAHKPLLFQEGGGDLLVNLKSHHRGWTNTSGDLKVTAVGIAIKFKIFIHCSHQDS